MGDRNRRCATQTPRSDGRHRLVSAYRDLQETLATVDLADDDAAADAVIVALRAADYAYTMEVGADGLPSVSTSAE